MRVNPENLPHRYQKQIAEQLKESTPTQLEPIPPDVETKADKISEAKLQRHCEDYATLHGYLRLTADNAEKFDPTIHKGFFGHMNKPKMNPLMPDFWVFNTSGSVLCVELKVCNVYQPGQAELVAAGFWKLALTFGEFVLLLTEWEDEA